MDAIRFSLLAVLFLAVFSVLSNDVSAENETEHYFLNDGREFSTEYGEGEAIEEKPPSSWSSFGVGRNREQTEIGTWESEELIYNMTINGTIFNLWWVQDPADDQYGADVEWVWTFMIDGDVIFVQTDGEYNCKQDRGNPCEFNSSVPLDNEDILELTLGQILSVKLEYSSFADIYIYYDNITFDSGVTLNCVTQPDSCYENESPVAAILITPSPAVYNEVTELGGQFDVNCTSYDSDGTVVAYEWLFSMNNTTLYGGPEWVDNDVDPENCYFSFIGFDNGTYSVSFRVQDDDGTWSEWATVELVIHPPAPITTINFIEAKLIHTITYLTSTSNGMLAVIPRAEAGATVTFNGTGLDGNGTVVVAYRWESSIDGVLSTETEFSISNLSFGNHTITFSVQDSNGLWGNDQVFFKVYAAPVAIPGADLKDIEIGSVVQFAGAGTDEDGTIVKYEWDFDGDGIFEWVSDENGITTFIYNKAGIYFATLKVTDSDGNIDTDSRSIEVAQGLSSSIPGLIIDAEAGLLIVATIGLIIAIFSRRD